MEALTEYDCSAIQNMMLTRSHFAIADMLDLDQQQVADYIKSITADTGIVTFQMKIDKRKKAQPNRAKKEKPQKEKSLMAQRRLVQKQPVITLPKRQESIYKTQNVNYGTKVLVKIDRKTSIYINKGEDRQAAIDRFKKNYKPALMLED